MPQQVFTTIAASAAVIIGTALGTKLYRLSRRPTPGRRGTRTPPVTIVAFAQAAFLPLVVIGVLVAQLTVWIIVVYAISLTLTLAGAVVIHRMSGDESSNFMKGND